MGWRINTSVHQAIIGLDYHLSMPDRRQAIIGTIAGILSIELLETISSEILVKIQQISYKKINLNVSSAKYRSFCLDHNMLNLESWA